MYVLKNNNNEYVVFDDGNSPSLSMDMKFAHVFPKESTAIAFAKNSIPRKLKTRFGTLVTVEIPNDVMEDLTGGKSEGDIMNDVILNENLNNLPKSISALRDKVNNIRTEIDTIVSTKDTYVTRLSVIDQKLTDLDHYIEFNDKNVVDSFKLLKLRQNLLRERREIKFNIVAIQGIISGCENLLNGNVEKSLLGLGGCQYTPRQLSQLFSGVKISEYNIENDHS